MLNFPPISFNLEGFTRTLGQQKERLRKLISSRYKEIPAPEGANALLIGGFFEHWEDNLTYPASYCHVYF